MSRVVLTAMMSLDGMFDGPGQGAERIDWFRADEEWLAYSVELLDRAHTLLFGRRTFDGMSSYWSTQTDPVAQRMNALPKVGFSRSPQATTWTNARMSTRPVDEVAQLRRTQGDGDIVIMGSADLAATLTAHGLIDEYRVAVNPVIIGAGTPLFAPGSARTDLRTDGVRRFRSGIVEIRLRPDGLD